MGDLISKAAVKKMFDNWKIVIDEDVLNCNSIHETLLYLLNKIAEFIEEKVDEIPVINAVHVVYGEWIAQDEGLTKFMCSVCKGENHSGHEKFCPECGADMRKKV